MAAAFAGDGEAAARKARGEAGRRRQDEDQALHSSDIMRGRG
jgi:hypothetical protein